MIPIKLLASEPRTASFDGELQRNAGDYLGVKLYLDITGVSGTTPTLDIKLQGFDLLSGKFFDIPGAAFAQKTVAGQDDLLVQPSATPVANEAVSQALPDRWRVAVAIGGATPSFTFSLGAVLLEPNN